MKAHLAVECRYGPRDTAQRCRRRVCHNGLESDVGEGVSDHVSNSVQLLWLCHGRTGGAWCT